jgi:DNA-directed RNA polymerase specialized sigma24 family protein
MSVLYLTYLTITSITVPVSSVMSYDSFWYEDIKISSVDQHGRAIAPEVLTAAHDIGRRALRLAEKELGDPATAASILEHSAALVSRALYSSPSAVRNCTVKNLQGYLFRAVVRNVDRLKLKELPTISGPEAVLQRHAYNPSSNLETLLLTNELLAKADNFTRRVFQLRVEGYSWKEIGPTFGIDAHAAESRYSQGLKRIRKGLLNIRTFPIRSLELRIGLRLRKKSRPSRPGSELRETSVPHRD